MTDNKLSPMEKYDHVDGDKPGFFERVNNWKSKNPKLRTLLAVGGWVYESFFTFKKKKAFQCLCY
jgi:GH18 family chitinase